MPPFGKERALRERVAPAGEVARAEQRRHARDVGAEGERRQIELQLDVLVELLRHARRFEQSTGSTLDALAAS